VCPRILGNERKVIPMRVKFIDGPLDGEVRELADQELEDGSVIQLPSGAEENDPAMPGDETTISYLYEGDGVARYIGGVAPG
jgi:hypothetical protein